MFFIKDIRKQNLVIFISKVADTGKMFFLLLLFHDSINNYIYGSG